MEELNRISPTTYRQLPNQQIVVVLDNIRSMHNVGAAFRTADAFGIGHIYLCGLTAQPPHREIEKTALGATDSVAWTYYAQTTEALTLLKQFDYQLVAIEQTDKSIALQDFLFEKTQKYALIFGNEVFGVEEQCLPYCDKAIEIPQSGTKHSLNISVCVGIVLWQYRVACGFVAV
jgi:23S rRNA (guanosine2251-2'-O)-methyltransferase